MEVREDFSEDTPKNNPSDDLDIYEDQDDNGAEDDEAQFMDDDRGGVHGDLFTNFQEKFLEIIDNEEIDNFIELNEIFLSQ